MQRLLLVDLDADFLSATSQWLQEQGFVVQTAQTRAQAASELLKTTFSAGIFQLSGPLGLEWAEEIHSRYPQMHLLLAGLPPLPEEQSRAHAMGAVLLPRPFLAHELLTALPSLTPQGASPSRREVVARLSLGQFLGEEQIGSFLPHDGGPRALDSRCQQLVRGLQGAKWAIFADSQTGAILGFASSEPQEVALSFHWAKKLQEVFAGPAHQAFVAQLSLNDEETAGEIRFSDTQRNYWAAPLGQGRIVLGLAFGKETLWKQVREALEPILDSLTDSEAALIYVSPLER